ncbi:MAG: helix-turn-helix domain-containing protein [Planctomycetota bacterium]|nr:helix-turn-helix domain-containing protein [Planctomycetota bacterium]
MASKYLSIEETIELLGIPQEEITRLREAGDLRGFADRGTWKFRAEDVEEFSRSRQADSSDNVGLGDDELSLEDDDFESLGTASLLDEDDEVSAHQPTLIQQTTDDEPLLSLDDTSDSDVRLVIDDSLEPGDLSESDSDVRLVMDDEPLLAESDSEIQLVADAQPTDDMAGSDSDVKLVATDPLDATIIETPQDSEDLGMTEIAEGSDLSIDQNSNSGISLEAVAESGISLEAADESGISLEPSGSGVELSEMTLVDSGISLDLDGESGISLDLDDKTDETQLEVPALVEDGTDFEMAGADDDETGTDTSVLLFDDEEDADDYSATVVKKSDDDDIFDEFGDIGDDDDLDVVDDDIFGEDDELEDLDVFDADDDVFDDEEVDDYAVPVERIVAPVEQAWGVGTFLSLLTGTGLMIVCGMVLFELVKSIWSAEDPGFTGTLIDSVGGMFN